LVCNRISKAIQDNRVRKYLIRLWILS
jgi:hypothetical protein